MPSLYNLDADGLYSRHFSESLVGRLDAPNVPLIPTSDDRDVATIQINSGSDAPASGFASLLASARLLQQETIMDVCSSNLMADRTRDRASSEGAGCTDTLPELRNSNETMIGLSVTQLAPDDGDDGDDDDDDTARLASSNPVDICSRTREDTGRTRTKSASDDNINTLQRHHRRNRRNSRRRRYRRSREQELSSGSRRASTLTASAITLDGGDVSEQEQNRPILDDYLDDVNQLGPRTYDNEDDDEGEDLVGIGEDGDEDD
ncbi:unnamed protein product [Protopolystoma xenopodis]|uniref:Uncharacterized protein n=1 Tax=Protopolystoma xenopodis TaxID=117903 RepID=A0A448XJL3_9PLAT|nr:unnamed protein product [Protopolystoma xenopodis]